MISAKACVCIHFPSNFCVHVDRVATLYLPHRLQLYLSSVVPFLMVSQLVKGKICCSHMYLQVQKANCMFSLERKKKVKRSKGPISEIRHTSV